MIEGPIYVSYTEADKMIKADQRWKISPVEDYNTMGAMTQMVFIEKRERIVA